MDLPHDRVLAGTEAVMVDETGLNRSARLYFPPGSITLILHASHWAGSVYYGFVIFSPGPVSVEVHILAIHFLKIISAKSITRRSLGTGRCLQRLNCVDQHYRQAPFQQIKAESVLLSGVTRGKAAMSDKKRKLWVIWLCYDHFNQWFSGTGCIFLQCTLPVVNHHSSGIRDWSYLLVGTRVSR